MEDTRFGVSIVGDHIKDLETVCVVEEAMELLNDGFPLDDDIAKRLKEVGIDPTRFTEIHQDKIN